MGELAPLKMRETVRVDERRVRNIVNELGESAAEEVIQLALEQMASAVRGLQARVREGAPGPIIAQADRLSRLAWQVGLVSLAGVALDVGDCARQGDETALAATMARVVRVSARSLSDIWEVEIDLPG